jgi:RNA polymerase sigma-70 factor (ECF subfamily)
MEISSCFERGKAQSMEHQDYFNKIYDDTYAEILKYVIIKTSRADQVDDIIQNVYINFYSRIIRKGFDDIRFPEAFIIKLTEKELSRHYKRTAEKREAETDIDKAEEQLDAIIIPFDLLLENKDALDAVQSIVKKLPLLSFKAFILFYYYDMPIARIAEQLDISDKNVKTRLWRARLAVRKDINHDEQ